MTIGGKVRELRTQLNLTQVQFASKIVSHELKAYGGSYIGKIEIGKQDPSVKYLRRIAETFGKPLRYFFSDEEPKGLDEKNIRSKKVQAIVCLIGTYNWELGHFGHCRACDQMPLCRTVRALVNQ